MVFNCTSLKTQVSHTHTKIVTLPLQSTYIKMLILTDKKYRLCHYPTSYLSRTMLAYMLNSSSISLDQLCDFPLPSDTLFGYSKNHTSKSYFDTGVCIKVSPLILAIRNKDFMGVKNLLKHRASCNFADDHKLTPLMHAVRVVRFNWQHL